MPQSRFTRKSDIKGKKRKKTVKKQTPNKLKTKDVKSKRLQENISSDDELSGRDEGYPESSDNEETELEQRARIAKEYLAQYEKEEREKNLLDDTKEAVAQRLKDEVLEEAGRLQKKKAHEYENVAPEVLHVFKGHNLSITCIVVSSTEKFFFSGSKDSSIIKWSIEEKKKLKTIRGGKKKDEALSSIHHHILAMALSSDDKFLASGCKNNIINIWNPETLELLKTFRGHKDAITGLVFQRGTHQLISASHDRSLKLWNLDEMGYVETLFGHQDAVTGVDCFLGETALTSGGRDNTVRIWKIVEESQLVYQGYGASIDCVCVSSFQSFVSGGDDGSLLFWGIHKKKPMSKVIEAHGSDLETEEANWIVSLCALQNTDLVASGSKDGFIRLWKRDDDSHSLLPVSRIPVSGFVNSMQFTQSGKYLIAGVGQEHRLGRWWKIKESKNSIVLLSWKNKS